MSKRPGARITVKLALLSYRSTLANLEKEKAPLNRPARVKKSSYIVCLTPNTKTKNGVVNSDIRVFLDVSQKKVRGERIAAVLFSPRALRLDSV